MKPARIMVSFRKNSQNRTLKSMVSRPTLKQPGEDWQYLQMVKQRENGRVIGTELQVIYGDEAEVLALLGKSTSYIERSNLTSRHFNSRLTRKTLAFSKTIVMHQPAAALEDAYYNLVWPHKTLRQEVVATDRRWLPRTPAMASALTEHIWTVKELFSNISVPNISVPIVNNT
jgi:hypothetical protein